MHISTSPECVRVRKCSHPDAEQAACVLKYWKTRLDSVKMFLTCSISFVNFYYVFAVFLTVTTKIFEMTY